MWCWLSSFTVDEVTSIIQAFAVAAVAVPAFRGLNSWRVQLLGKKKIELAEEALVLAYELQTGIEFARHAASFTGEGEERPNREQEPEGRRSLNDSYYSRISRLADNDEHFARLRTLRMLFRAYFGDEAQEAFKTFITTRNQISIAVGMLINRTDQPGYPQNLIDNYQNVIWDHSTDEAPDELSQTINDAVAEIERVCKPVLTKQ